MEESKISTIFQKIDTLTTLKIIETYINTTSLIASIIHENSQIDYSNKAQTNNEFSNSIESKIQTVYQNQSHNKISQIISQSEFNYKTNLIISGNNEDIYEGVIDNILQNNDISKGEDNFFFHI